MSPDHLLYVADMVSADEAVLSYIDGVTFEVFVGNDEKRAAVERQLFVIVEAAARMSHEWKDARPQSRGARVLACAICLHTATG